MHVHVHALSTVLRLQVVVGVGVAGLVARAAFLQDPDLPFPPPFGFNERSLGAE